MLNGILPTFTQVQVKVMTIMNGLIQLEPKNFLWIGHRVRQANRIDQEVANKLIEILLTSFSAVQKTLCN